MASSYEYKRYVVGGGHYRPGMIEMTDEKNIIHWKKWNMRKVALSGMNIFWEVGYIHRGRLAYQTNSAHTGFCPSYFYSRLIPPSDYWWCRDGDWMPFWGNLTKTRAALMTEIRGYWRKKWFGEEIPKIKTAIKEVTILSEDIIEDLSTYYEYPYQVKKLVTRF